MKSVVSLLLLVIVCAAVALRLPTLDVRPMHADESVQATRFRDLWQQGQYVYDPNEYHGPTLMYATLPSVLLSGKASYADTTAATYRSVTALFGVGVVFLLILFLRRLDPITVVAAAALAAVSPAMVFYSRYFIHETLLVFFTLAAIACGWQYVISRKLVWCLLAGACIGLMQATKETAAISYLAAGSAVLLAWLNDYLVRRARANSAMQWLVQYLFVTDKPDSDSSFWNVRASEDTWSAKPWSWQHLLAGALTAIVVAAVLLSSFLTNLRGPIDGVLTYLPWLSRAGGESPHIYPWSFYLHRLVWWRVGQGPVWSEGFIVLLAAIGFVRAVVGTNASASGLVRWLAWYTLVLTALYCVIPYKTPWCLLQFLVGMILLAGYGASGLLCWPRPKPVRAIIAALLVLGAVHLGWQAYRASFVRPADVGNPYVFAHTSQDITRLAKHLQGLLDTSAQGSKTPVKVIWTDAYYWPLPWYLRKFDQDNVELWRTMPQDPLAPIVISAIQYDRELEDTLGRDYIMVVHELRPQVHMQLWVEFDLWEAYLRRTGQIE